MGKLALAAKITHVPSMYLSELPGPHQGCRQAAIDGHVEIGRRCRELDIVVAHDGDVVRDRDAGLHQLLKESEGKQVVGAEHRRGRNPGR